MIYVANECCTFTLTCQTLQSPYPTRSYRLVIFEFAVMYTGAILEPQCTRFIKFTIVLRSVMANFILLIVEITSVRSHISIETTWLHDPHSLEVAIMTRPVVLVPHVIAKGSKRIQPTSTPTSVRICDKRRPINDETHLQKVWEFIAGSYTNQGMQGSWASISI